MSVIFITVVAVTLGGILAALLAMLPKKNRCGKRLADSSRWNSCALHENHEGHHWTAEGKRFK